MASHSGVDRVREVLRRRGARFAFVGAAALAALGGSVAGLPDAYVASATLLVEAPQGVETVPAELEARLVVIGQQILSRGSLLALAERFSLHPELRSKGAAEALLFRLR